MESINGLHNQVELIITKLNNDCLLNIFQYLSVTEKLTIERVCKRFNFLSKLSWISIKNCKLFLNNDSSQGNSYFNDQKISNKAINQVLDRCGAYLETVKIECYINSKKEKTICTECPQVFKKLAHNTGNIQCFKFDNVNFNEDNKEAHQVIDEDFKLLFLKNPALQSLDLRLPPINGKCFSALPVRTIHKLILKPSSYLQPKYIKKYFSMFKNLKEFTLFVNSFTLEAMDAIFETVSENSSITQELKVYLYLHSERRPIHQEEVESIYLLKKNIKILSLCKVLIDNEFLLNMSDSEVEKIYFDSCGIFKSELYYLPKYKNLNKFVFDDTFDDTYIEAFSSCKNLRYLTLMCNVEFEEHFSYFENLEYLEMFVFSIGDKFLTNVAKCKQLKTIVLTIFGDNFTDKGLSKLSYLPKLEYLRLSAFPGSYNLKGKSFGNLTQLKALSCSYCDGIQDEGLCTLIQNSSNLEYLRLSSCSYVTNKIIECAIIKKNIDKGKVLYIAVDSRRVDLNKINITSPFVDIAKGSFPNKYYHYDSGE